MNPKTGQKGNLSHMTWQISPSHCWLKIPISSDVHPQRPLMGNLSQCSLIPNWTLVLVLFLYPMKSTQWVSIRTTFLLTSMNWLQTSMILLMCPALPLTLVVTSTKYSWLQVPSKYCKNYIQRTRSSWQSGAFCKVKPYIPPHHRSQKCWRVRHPENTVESLYVAFSVTHLAIPVQTVPQQNASVQTVLKNIMSYSKTVPWKLLPSTSNMA